MLVEIGCFVPTVLLQCIKKYKLSGFIFPLQNEKTIPLQLPHIFEFILSVRNNARVKDRIILRDAKYLITETNLIVMVLLFRIIK